MITIITGQPGNGKTLMGMWLMAKEYERNRAAVKAGKEQPRRFFSNVKGATTEENPEAFPWVERMPDHNDWTKLPHGSFVQLDEAHSDGETPGLERYGHLFPSTGKPGESSDHRIRALSTSRSSFSIDLQLITQWPSKIHHQVRTLAGEHIHMSRAFGLQRAGVLKWTRVQADPYDEDQREKAEEEIWPYPKEIYSRYVSATIHTAAHRFKVPPALWKGLSMLVAFGLIVWVFLTWVRSNTEEQKQAAKPAAAQAQGQGRVAPAAPAAAVSAVPVSNPGTGIYESLRAPATPRIVGYIDSPRGCRMWNDKGEQLDIAQDECRRMVAKGIPVHFLDAGGSKRDRADRKPVEGAGQSPAAMDAASAAFAPSSGQGATFGSMAAYGKDGLGAY